MRIANLLSMLQGAVIKIPMLKKREINISCLIVENNC